MQRIDGKNCQKEDTTLSSIKSKDILAVGMDVVMKRVDDTAIELTTKIRKIEFAMC